MNNAEEATKLSKDVKFTTLGRSLADAARSGTSTAELVAQAAILRRIEQDSADKATRFAGLARQVGDAARNGKDIDAHLQALVDLRSTETGARTILLSPRCNGSDTAQ
jgi:hypothetical protein